MGLPPKQKEEVINPIVVLRMYKTEISANYLLAGISVYSEHL
jgi:hypothetical protein